jgi:hypothetical protein
VYGGGGGGAGGGALLIASSTSVTVNGTISSNGGAGPDGGGGGAAGGIRLLAQTIAGTGLIQTSPGAGCGSAAAGIIRLEAYHFTFTGREDGIVTSGTPFATFVPTPGNPVPAVTVVSVGGIAVNPHPTGSFNTPDVTINSSAALPIVVQGSNVPVGTVVHVRIYSDNGPDIVRDTPGLEGTLKSSTAMVNVPFPPGYSRGFVSVSFTTGGSSATTKSSTASVVLGH